jgi:hypothetical protein
MKGCLNERMPSEAAFAAIVDRLAQQDDVTLGSAFHSPSLKVRGKLFATLVRGELAVKLPAARCGELSRDQTAHPLVVGPRTMREWAVVGADRTDAWLALAEEALDHVRPSRPAAIVRRRGLPTHA